MESKSTSGVLRRKAPSFRHYPYGRGRKEDMEEEVVRLGVDLSVCVAESMFLLCDDIRTLLSFCFKLWRYVLPYPNPVLERLFRVIHYVYLKDIKPKNEVYQSGGKSAQWNLIRASWSDFVCGITVLNRLVFVLRRGKDHHSSSFDGLLLSSDIAKHKQLVKNLEDQLRSAKHVSEANGFVRETIESNVFYLWQSLFDDEEVGKETPQVLKNRILSDLFNQLLATSWDEEIWALPIYYPTEFAREELKQEAVRLGVELSLYVAQSMFLLCDDIRSMLWFCSKLWRDAKSNMNPNSPVAERLIRVIHYVYLRGIKPKNGVYKNDGISLQLSLVGPTCRQFEYGITNLDLLVSKLTRQGSCLNIGHLMTSSIEQVVNKVEETLRCGKAVAEANGFRREGIECIIFGLWKSLFDREAKEATQTLKVIKTGILRDLFLPLHNQVAPLP